MKRWINDLGLGVRLSVSGGREGWLRTALTAVGVGLGVALLLVSAAVPHMLAQRGHRGAEREYLQFGQQELARADNTLLVQGTDTVYRGKPVFGLLLRAEGPAAPVPPGLAALPGPDDLVVSPALADLLSKPEGSLLRDRLPGHIKSVIDDEGLAGPNELAYYGGSDTLGTDQVGVIRIDHFGESHTGEGLDPVLALLVLVIFVVLLLPIGIFVAAAIRFGSDRRDQRLAAVRLVGADGNMARRIAAGEALSSAVLGLAVGTGIFFLGRQLVERITLLNVSVFATDVSPSLVLGLLIVAAVPVAAVGLTVLSLRRVIIEPLGVVRQSRSIRRRLWWRLTIPLLGLPLLFPLLGDINKSGGQFNQYQVGAGLILLLLGTASLLPWVVQAVVRRLGRGSVSWQLAIRRLQLDSTASVRAVTGVAVATAGAIALQMFFAAADMNYRTATGADPTRAQITTLTWIERGVQSVDTIDDRLRATPGVTSVTTFQTGESYLPKSPGQDDEASVVLYLGDCAVLAQLATTPHCGDGDIFLFGPRADNPYATIPQVGQLVTLGSPDGTNSGRGEPEYPSPNPQWTIPASAQVIEARLDPAGSYADGIFLTPAAAARVLGAWQMSNVTSYLNVDPAATDVEDLVRNTAATISPTTRVQVLRQRTDDSTFADIRRGLLIGSMAVLLLIGASLLVNMLDQLRERRRLFAVLIAFGTRRSTLTWSVLWQAALPVALGVGLAIITGAGLGALLLTMIQEAVRFDWRIIGGLSTAAAGVVLLVTLLSLPALWRITRPDGLRTE